MRAPDPETVRAALSAARPRVVAALAAHLRDIDRAEDAFADACAAYLAGDAEPQSLEGWLITVAKRKAIDAMRRRDAEERAVEAEAQITPQEDDMGEVIAFPDPIPDERLRLIFICCHPAIGLEARTALALKVICGLSVADIGRLFLTNEATMYQRITRAKAKIRDAGIAFELPHRKEWGERLEAVLLTLELAYTVAYQDAGGLRPGNEGGELGDEIERLAAMLAELIPNEPEVLGIAALVTLARSRDAARVDANGAMVPLSKQDVTLWDLGRIKRASTWMDQAAGYASTGPYQVMAAIQLSHAQRAFEGSVNWASIVKLYDGLMRLRPSAVVALNRAVANAEIAGAEKALAELDALASERLENSRPYHAARAHLLEKLGRVEDAISALDNALAQDPPPAEKAFLEAKRAALTV